MTTRRGFFGSIAGLIASLYSVGKFTYGLQPMQPGPAEYLTQVWNRFSKGKRYEDLPKTIWVSEEFFDLFERDLKPLQRITPRFSDPKERVLAFKACKLKIDYKLKGWNTTIG